jgi:heat shock protein HtpX
MTVYNQISENKIKTFFIMFLFVLIFSGFFFLIGKVYDDPWGYLTLGLIISLVSSIGSYYFSDKLILLTVKAIPADKRKYFNFYTVTENLAISSGLPMPKLYVIEDSSPNAFATGRDNKHAIVCATTGLLDILDRGELEGVIGHELYHIKNYDMLVMSIVSVLVGTISLISDWVIRRMWWGGNDRENRNNANPILFILFIISLVLTPIAATLIQLSISRKREFLADASSALLTRNPNGLISALQKLNNYNRPLASATNSTAHLFIVNPLRKSKSIMSKFSNLFSTHPPIEERIKILKSM